MHLYHQWNSWKQKIIHWIDTYLFLFLKLRDFIVGRTRTSCFYLLPLPCYWVVVHIFCLVYWRIRTSHYSRGCVFVMWSCAFCVFLFLSHLHPAFVIEIMRVDMNKPVDVLNLNIESISLFDMKGLGMVLPRWSIATSLLNVPSGKLK